MSLIITYKNELGEVVMKGGGSDATFRITAIEGLGLVARDYSAAVYSGYDGQETLNSRNQARTITIGIEVMDKDVTYAVRSALHVLSREGTLYIKNDNTDRRIRCSQVQIPDVTRVLQGEIASFGIQLVCDSPYFEDGTDTVVPLYRRTKLLKTPFTFPAVFGDIVVGATIRILGTASVEPIITLYYPSPLEGVERIVITNETTGASIKLDYAPQANDTVTIDIKNRKILSSVSGNLINYLAEDTFLGDFALVYGVNVLSVDLGDVTSGFTIECRYNNLYNEAVVV